MSDEQAEVMHAFRTLRRHLPKSLRAQEADLEAAWFNGAPLPVDWPARFRAAAVAARDTGAEGLFLALAAETLPAHVVEAVGRALGGEEAS